MSDTPEKDKYLKWFDNEKKKGLVDIKVSSVNSLKRFLGEDINENINEEDIYRELNSINDAITEGNYKVVAEINAKGKFINDKEFFLGMRV